LIVGVVIVGVAIVGPVANTAAPDPVSSVSAAARFALDGVAKKVDTFAPSEAIDSAPIAAGVIATEAAEVMRPLSSTVN
jgi:hypothetical protein